MKYKLLILLTIILQHSYGQVGLHGIILDSVSMEPVPFASISINNQVKTSSDFYGEFQLGQLSDSTVLLKVEIVGYLTKKILVEIPQDSLILTLSPIPIEDPANFIIWSKPTDTTYYKNGNIHTIKYRGHDTEQYYPSGQKEFMSTNGSTKSWYETGRLKNVSVLWNNHFRYEKTWYPSGLKKSEGSLTWRHNEKKNEGEWIKNNDWTYWNKKGEERNNR